MASAGYTEKQLADKQHAELGDAINMQVVQDPMGATGQSLMYGVTQNTSVAANAQRLMHQYVVGERTNFRDPVNGGEREGGTGGVAGAGPNVNISMTAKDLEASEELARAKEYATYRNWVARYIATLDVGEKRRLFELYPEFRKDDLSVRKALLANTLELEDLRRHGLNVRGDLEKMYNYAHGKIPTMAEELKYVDNQGVETTADQRNQKLDNTKHYTDPVDYLDIFGTVYPGLPFRAADVNRTSPDQRVNVNRNGLTGAGGWGVQMANGKLDPMVNQARHTRMYGRPEGDMAATGVAPPEYSSPAPASAGLF